MNALNLLYHCHGACFKPYSDFYKWQTWSFFLRIVKSSGCFMYISSSNSPWRNAVFTSSCSNSRSNRATNASNTLIEVCRTTREKTSLKSIPFFLLQPWTTGLSFHLAFSTPGMPSFLLETYLAVKGRWPLGNSHDSQVLFLCRLSISSCIALS